MSNRKVRSQTKLITIPSGAAQGVYPFEVSLDRSFDITTGVQLIEIHSGGVLHYDVEIKDQNNKVLHDAQHKSTLQANTNLPLDERFRTLYVRQKSGEATLYGNIITYAVPTADIVIQLIFQLEKE